MSSSRESVNTSFAGAIDSLRAGMYDTLVSEDRGEVDAFGFARKIAIGLVRKGAGPNEGTFLAFDASGERIGGRFASFAEAEAAVRGAR